MDKDIAFLMELGASKAQARKALRQSKDLMQAAEKYTSGDFDNILDDIYQEPVKSLGRSRLLDYKSYGRIGGGNLDMDLNNGCSPDPYSDMVFSKNRRKEVVEIEEEPEFVKVHGYSQKLRVISLDEWKKGCPEGDEQFDLVSLYSQLGERDCYCPKRCGFKVKRNKADLFAIHPGFTSYIHYLKGKIQKRCSTCLLDFCMACGERITANRGDTDSSDLLFHCPDLQGVIIGVGLIMLELMFLEKFKDDSETVQKSERHESTPSANASTNDQKIVSIGKGKRAKNGTGYAGSRHEDTSGQTQALNKQKSKDEEIENLLREIRKFLPNRRREEGQKTSDHLPHPSTLAHLRRRFNYVSGTLLRNASLSDISDRSALYFELFEWLEIISMHEALASMMGMPIMVVGSVKSVITNNTGRSSQSRTRTLIYEDSSSPRELLQAILIQAQFAYKGLEDHFTDEINLENDTTGQGQTKRRRNGAAYKEKKRVFDFCKRIISTTGAIDQSLKKTKGDKFYERLIASQFGGLTIGEKSISASASKEQLASIYSNWATSTRFAYCKLTVPVEIVKKGIRYIPKYKHYYDDEARKIDLNNRDRSLAVIKQVVDLTTGLPAAWDASIFVRVAEERQDMIKCLITGPPGTPYHNGCYLFDILLPENFNKSPPLVQYLTTNEGRFRFNPNLYADGKVCLSLLGTWEGPGWTTKSTLLQVLVSIQAMILCDQPYLNEPGHSKRAGTPESKAYSAKVRRMVVHTAMLGNLKNPPEPFADVIRTHFLLKAPSIIAQLDEWLTVDDSPVTNRRMSPFQRDVAELKTLLYELQRDGDISGLSSL